MLSNTACKLWPSCPRTLSEGDSRSRSRPRRVVPSELQPQSTLLLLVRRAGFTSSCLKVRSGVLPWTIGSSLEEGFLTLVACTPGKSEDGLTP